MNPDCYFGDHEWRGGVCVGCGERFRCECGQFLYADDARLTAHAEVCPVIRKLLAHSHERRDEG
jgi:hypothetical protein